MISVAGPTSPRSSSTLTTAASPRSRKNSVSLLPRNSAVLPMTTAVPEEVQAPPVVRRRHWAGPTGLGLAVIYLSLIVLIPLGAVDYKSQEGGFSAFWHALTAPQPWAALKLTVYSSLIV